MSDADVGRLVQEIEDYLKETQSPDPEYFADWNTKFNQAAEKAERGPGWRDIVDRAHAVGKMVQNRVSGLNYERDQLRDELNAQSLGQRALKGYSASTQ